MISRIDPSTLSEQEACDLLMAIFRGPGATVSIKGETFAVLTTKSEV
jgi:hypothetical protein